MNQDTTRHNRPRRQSRQFLGVQISSCDVSHDPAFNRPLNILSKKLCRDGPVPIQTLWRATVAEFFATMFFIFFVSASVAIPTWIAGVDTRGAVVMTALIQGLSIIPLISVNANISGGHLNPAVTLCLVVVRSVDIATGFCYIIAQFLGAIVGAALFYASAGASIAASLSSTVPVAVDVPRAILMEFMITCMLLYTVLGTAVHAESGVKALAPLPIGFAICVGVLLANNVTGASMNIARTFGPAVVSNTWTRQYVFWISNFLAAIVVGLLYKVIFLSQPISASEALRLRQKEGLHVAEIREATAADMIQRTAPKTDLATELETPMTGSPPSRHHSYVRRPNNPNTFSTATLTDAAPANDQVDYFRGASNNNNNNNNNNSHVVHMNLPATPNAHVNS